MHEKKGAATVNEVTEAAALVKIRLSKLGAWYSFSNDYTVMA